MRIAMIGQKRIPSREGGIEIVVEELAVRMAEMGHEVDCYNRWEDFSSKPADEYKNVHLIKIPTFKKQSLNAFVYSVLATAKAIFGHYDVIHIHAEGPAAMSFLPKMFGIPVVVTIHGLDWQRAKWGGFATKYLKFGERQAAYYSDSLIVLSRDMQQYFMREYGRDSIYLNNGVTIRPYVEPELIREKWGLEKESYILFLARLVPEKGIHYLIDAFKQLKTDKKLIIAGKLTNSDYVQKIQAMAADDDRIIFADFVTGRLMEELMSNTFLYVLPSDLEGMAISLLEALSYGIRCLVSDIKENVEAAKEYSDYFEKQNVDDLRDKLTYILKDHNDFDRAKQIKFVERNYNWDQVAMETIRIYETSIQSRKPFALSFNLNRTIERRKSLIAAIEGLEIKRKRAETGIMDSLVNNKALDRREVMYFNRYTSEIEILREQLEQLKV